jgi:hypothetical protein
MAFASADNASESRKAVAGLLGIAMRQGFLVATTDHYDLTPGVAGRAPLAPTRDGSQIPAPDIILFGTIPGSVFGVEVETRTFMRNFPDATPVEVAKLRDNLEIELTAAVYARTIQGDNYDAAVSWRQRDIAALLRAYKEGRVDFVNSKKGLLLVLANRDLNDLDQLWRRLRGQA